MSMTLKELQAAYAEGKVKQPMFIDNDYVEAVIVHDPDWVNVETVYRRDCVQDVLNEALDMLGIPHEYA